MNWLKWLLAIGLAALAIGAGIVAIWPQPIAVDTAKVERGHFEQVVEDDARTRVRERYTVYSPVSGDMLRIELKAGDTLVEGQTLVTIVPNPPAILDVRTRQEMEQRLGAAEAHRLRARAALERAESVLQQAQVDLQRTQTLAQKGASPLTQLEREQLAARLASREVEAARFEDHAAEHEVELARTALADSRQLTPVGEPWVIRAPTGGKVLRIMHESEGAVEVGAPLLEIGDPTELEIVADILSTDAVSIQPGASARIVGWGGDKPLSGRVRRVEPSAFTKVSALGIEEQRVNTIVDIVSPPAEWGRLGDGFRVDVEIVTFATDDALEIPTGALVRGPKGWQVYTIVDGRARLRSVEVARQSGMAAMIASGLEPGDRLIVYPSDLVRDGAKVTARQ